MSDTIRQALQQEEAQREEKKLSRIKRNSELPSRGCQTAGSAFGGANQWLHLSETTLVRLWNICSMQILRL